MTLAAFILVWLDSISESINPKTVSDYRAILNQLPQAMLAAPLEALTSKSISKWLNSLNRKPKTCYNYWKCLNKLLSDAVSHGLIKSNPALGCRPEATPSNNITVLPANEFHRLRRYAETHSTPKNLILYLILSIGLNVGEACALRRQDYDPLPRSLQIAVSITRSSVYSVSSVLETKLGSNRRTVSLDACIAGLLEEYIAQLPPEQNRLFVQKSGLPMEPKIMEKHLFETTAALSCRIGITFVILRDTYIVSCLDAGESPYTVAARVGIRPDTFKRHYLNKNREELSE